ncbi:sensor histidine kinase [Streptococcus tangpeifui]|uniref:sensor histidine kinase n=1 Tax=Streptococcus tangpeifui TaxID=2709400 RepID=UPI0013E9EB36|nr:MULTISPECIES: HAMP domain-containing sensor histidine kinase [unclassified Streptococcus]
MFRHLRIRIIMIAAAALLAALFLFASVLNSAYYLTTNRQIDSALQLLSTNKGELAYNSQTSERLGITSPDALYKYRYFSILLDKDNHLVSASIENIRSVKDGDIDTIMQKLSRSDEPDGKFILRGITFSYRKTLLDNHRTLIVVLDSSEFYESSNRLSRLTYFMSVISFIVFLVIFTVFSGRIIRPFVRNMDKQRRFITNAGHELKTPLAIIQANTELQELMTGETEWSTSTKDQVTRLTNLINSMVALARLEEQPDLVLADVNLSEVTQDAAEDFKGPVVRDGKSFVMEIIPDIHIQAEEKSIFELVTILVDNANKYCDPGGQVSVHLSQVGRTRKRARLQISNTYKEGQGIDYSKFFERFYREEESHNNKKKSGFGIGLSMAQSVAKLFRGRIFATYKDDTITFTVVFPKS